MKKIISALLVVVMALALVACSDKNDKPSDNGDFYSSMDKAYLDKITSNKTVDLSKTVEVVMKVQNFGLIELELYPETAPVTVANFVNLVQSGFYNGLSFHRIINNFMIQGGDPQGTGMGGSPEKITGEFSANGFTKNTLSHKEGVISMARSQDMNSASSQFFICDADAPHLDGQYAAFGMVTKGIDVVQKISEVQTNMSDMPLSPVIIEFIVLKQDYKPEDDKGDVIDEALLEKKIDVVISVKSFGDIKLELYPDIAPETVANFVKLAKDGFYDGLTFHRIIDNFMIQGGDPKGDGSGGSEVNIKGEFAANGFRNPLSHKAGVISMARTQDMNSASSQFFICDADAPHLDGQYAAFGKVVEGMDVVQKISEVETAQNDAPVTPVVIETVKVK